MPTNTIIRNQKGQGLIEYLILVALLAIASIGITRVLGQTIKMKYTEITHALQGQQRKMQYQEIDSSQFQKSDLSNFMKGAASPKENSRK